MGSQVYGVIGPTKSSLGILVQTTFFSGTNTGIGTGTSISTISQVTSSLVPDSHGTSLQGTGDTSSGTQSSEDDDTTPVWEVNSGYRNPKWL